ncbi:MAG: hypothetical protein KJ749_10310 [Planctomycetes bacterium]|nr:hypothetical protein [Planctomycetota bacterium]
MYTLRRICDIDQQDALEQFKWTPQDALLLGLIKSVFGWTVFRWLFRKTTAIACRISKSNYQTELEARYALKNVVDVYALIWFVILCSAYYCLAQSNSPVVGLACCLVAAFRLLEILSVSVRLHTASREYVTTTPARALLMAMISYTQAIIAFGVFYLFCALYRGDPFSASGKPCLQSEWANAIYFSSVTISTLGYGDFAPTQWLGKILTVAEILLGIMILVFAVQLTVAATSGRRYEGPTADPSAIPPWVEDVKFPTLKMAESEREKAGGIIDDLSEYLVLLFGDGDQLEMAVVKGLRALGLTAELAERGATIDVLAETQDGARKFGFEVTGTPEGIKKKSNKLGQVVEFERIKEHNEKTILLANTFKATTVVERGGMEHFTQPAVDFLRPYPVLMMTGWDLYRMVGDVLAEKRKQDELVGLLHTTTGVLNYKG